MVVAIVSNPRCTMTGIEIAPGDGVWDDGEWISWDWISSQLEEEGVDEPAPTEDRSFGRDGYPLSVLEQARILEELVDCASRHFENTGRYLQIWGELGELYAEVKWGLRRHGTHHPGSDGTIGGRLVEVKTISPEKSSKKVFVKSQGDFEQLLIVQIDCDFNFRAKLFEREELQGQSSKNLRGRLVDDQA